MTYPETCAVLGCQRARASAGETRHTRCDTHLRLALSHAFRDESIRHDAQQGGRVSGASPRSNDSVSLPVAMAIAAGPRAG